MWRCKRGRTESPSREIHDPSERSPPGTGSSRLEGVCHSAEDEKRASNACFVCLEVWFVLLGSSTGSRGLDWITTVIRRTAGRMAADVEHPEHRNGGSAMPRTRGHLSGNPTSSKR